MSLQKDVIQTTALIVFLLPVFLWGSVAPKLPEVVQTLAQGLPSLAMFQMVGLSQVESVTFRQVSPQILVMGMFVLLMFSLVAWRTRRLDR